MANGHGGKRPGAGRRPGAKNKATKQAKATLAELAGAYTEEALETLAEVMRNGASENARVVAANSLLDRAHGRPAQVSDDTQDDDAPSVNVRIEVAPAVGDVRVTKPDG